MYQTVTAGRSGDVKTIIVAAAVIIKDGKVFATQRGYGKYKDFWEFPGGKIEQGETPQIALAREIREELDTEIAAGEEIALVEYDYPEFRVIMHCLLSQIVSGDLVLKEHEASAWLGKNDLYSVKWLPSDLSVLEKIAQYLE